MKRIALVLFALFLIAGTAGRVLAQDQQDLETKMAKVNELKKQMETASPAEYDSLKTVFDALSTEVEAMVKKVNANKEAKARAITLYNEGNDALRARRYDEAIRNFRESSKLNPMEPRTQFSLGLALERKKDYNNALDAFQKATKIDPAYIHAFYAEGVLLTKMKRLDEAVDVFRTAVSVQGADSSALSKSFGGLGLAFYYQKNLDQSISAYVRATQLDPTNDDAWFNLGKAYGEKKDFSSAEDALKKAVNLDRRNPKYLAALAEKQNRLGKFSDAATSAQAATSLNPRFAAAWFELGWALENMGKKDEAVKAYEQAKQDRAYRQPAEYQIKLINGEF